MAETDNHKNSISEKRELTEVQMQKLSIDAKPVMNYKGILFFI